jgi:hypothetical protein
MTTDTHIRPGTRVAIVNPHEAYDAPLSARIDGKHGTVLAYATPDIRRNQAWTAESYYVILDGDAHGTHRVIDRGQIVVVR